MDTEQIIFLILAIIVSIFSMYRKSKKQKQQEQHTQPLLNEREKTYYEHQPQHSGSLESLSSVLNIENANYDHLSHHSDSLENNEAVLFFDQFEMTKLPKNISNYTKKNKKKQKSHNIETNQLQPKNDKDFSQDADLENNNLLFEDFEGTEIQRAFLYSEIFKNTNN